MEAPVPFCEECGVVGVKFSGLHPEEGGVTRWALYRCGHVRTEVVVDEVAADTDDAPRVVPSTGRIASSSR